jgi:propanol-preferring alcohol dehydrogenase
MRLHRPGPVSSQPLRAEQVPEPVPGPGELLIRVRACAVCRTDLQIATGDLTPRRLPITLGHQAVGRVEAHGADTTGWEPGDRVGAYWLAHSCGECRFCRSDRENLCESATFTGWDRDGGFAEMMVVDAAIAARVPASMTDVQAAPLLCGGVIGYRALRRAGVQPGHRVGLFGFGASALCALQVARYWGCDVYVCTRSDSEQRRARALGAVWAGSYDDPCPEPLDAAVTFAPVGWVVTRALAALDRGATLSINAIHLDAIPSFDYDDLWLERSIASVANVTRADARDFLTLAAAIPIQTSVEVFALEDANAALAALEGPHRRCGGTRDRPLARDASPAPSEWSETGTQR